jgi:hypothetical protein
MTPLGEDNRMKHYSTSRELGHGPVFSESREGGDGNELN